MMKFLLVFLHITMLVACGHQYEYVPPPTSFQESDLVGTWQAKYRLMTTDTITIKANGTYQQIYEAPESDYYYKSPWNKWYLGYSTTGKPTLHLEGMRYYAYTIELGEAGDPISFIDIDEESIIKITDKVILRVAGDKNAPRGIVLWHMHLDLDMSPPYFVLVDENNHN
jgi:hypothetical protein